VTSFQVSGPPPPPWPNLVRGGIVVMDPATARILRIIVFQFNPDTLTRTLQPQTIGQEPGDRLEALRLKGPPHETIKLDAEFDATEQLEKPLDAPNQTVAKVGLAAQLAALETLVYPRSTQLLANDVQAQQGAIEIAPLEAPLTLFVWSRNRIVPVRLTDWTVTEEAFDTSLNPIRAKVSLSMRVLTVDDLGFRHRGGAVYMAYQQQKEALAQQSQSGQLSALGITTIPGA
jgi:Contractile injection system tube protein